MIAATIRRQDDLDRDIRHAWYVAALSGRKKLPDLRDLLSRSRSDRPQTIGQQRQQMKMLADFLGVQLRPHTKGTP